MQLRNMITFALKEIFDHKPFLLRHQIMQHYKLLTKLAIYVFHVSSNFNPFTN